MLGRCRAMLDRSEKHKKWGHTGAQRRLWQRKGPFGFKSAMGMCGGGAAFRLLI